MIDNALRRPVLLVILDGFGVNPAKANNAITLAQTPNLDRYFARYPHTVLQASGLAVGLPEGQMGNSEVGHLTLGSGCVVRQDLVLIDQAIEDQSFFTNPELLTAIWAAAAQDRPLHVMGLVSDGGVHSHLRHLIALLKLCQIQKVRPQLHLFSDGRDTPPRSVLGFLKMIEEPLAAAQGWIGTVSGRYYALDRDQRWERTELAWRALIDNEGRTATTAQAAIELAYSFNEDDEFIRPTVLPNAIPICNNNQVIFFNFRKDRPRQLVAALSQLEFNHFDRHGVNKIKVTGMMEYDPSLNLPFAFKNDIPKISLGQIFNKLNISQLHCAETEKYAHVTFFFNSGRQEPFINEKWILIPSPKIATYDLQPEMSAPQVADAVIAELKQRTWPFIVVNFANGDMVGHTAIRSAVIAAVQALDHELGRVLDTAIAVNYSVIVTSDHGNCDELVDPITGAPQTQHSVYPVPCLIIDQIPWRLKIGGGIKDIAPTVLDLMGISIPDIMDGHSLLLEPASIESNQY